MASAKSYAPKDTGTKYPFKSVYGSHKEMVDEEATKFLSTDCAHLVVCRDTDGYYLTERKNLDSGCADPYRCSGSEWRAAFMKKHVDQADDGALIDADLVTNIEKDIQYEGKSAVRISFSDGTRRIYTGERAASILADMFGPDKK